MEIRLLRYWKSKRCLICWCPPLQKTPLQTPARRGRADTAGCQILCPIPVRDCPIGAMDACVLSREAEQQS